MKKSKCPHIFLKVNGVVEEVLINGNRINGVRKVSFTHEAGREPILTLDLLASDMELSGMMIPELAEIYKKFYVKK